jgi:hypothetical protein
MQEFNRIELNFILENLNYNYFDETLFETFGRFESFIDLRLILSESQLDIKDSIAANHLGTIEHSKNCKSLKKFELNIKYLTDEHFEDIDKYLPQLKSIRFESFSGFDLSDKTIKCFAKMPLLSSIYIEEFESITDSSVINVLNNCLNVKNIEINSFTNITEKSIEAFIEITKRNHKIDYKFSFNTINEIDINSDNNVIDRNEEQNSLQIGANLKLKFLSMN